MARQYVIALNRQYIYKSSRLIHGVRSLTWIIVGVRNNIYFQTILIKAGHGVGELKSLFPYTTERVVKWKHLKEFRHLHSDYWKEVITQNTSMLKYHRFGTFLAQNIFHG